MLPKLGLPKRMGSDYEVIPGMCPHPFPLAAPHWWSQGAVGVPSLGLEVRAALAQSHPSAFHGQQQESWNISHTKRRLKKTPLPAVPIAAPTQTSQH